MDIMTRYFPLQVLQSRMIDKFKGYDNHLGENVLVIPGGCGGHGWDIRRLDEAEPSVGNINTGLLTVSRCGGVDRSLPRAYPHEVIPLSDIGDWIYHGLDILNHCKDTIRVEHLESMWSYIWNNDPARSELWQFMFSLADRSDHFCGDARAEFMLNREIGYGQK